MHFHVINQACHPCESGDPSRSPWMIVLRHQANAAIAAIAETWAALFAGSARIELTVT